MVAIPGSSHMQCAVVNNNVCFGLVCFQVAQLRTLNAERRDATVQPDVRVSAASV